MIRATNISFSYGEKPILTNASFMVGNNQKIGLVGPNGAGKSTLFNLIAQKEFPEAGNIEVQGIVELVPQEVKRDSILEYAQSIRSYVDCTGQREDFELRRILDGLEAADLSLDSKPLNLSGGQKTKLAIARALLLEPDILLLDEPTNFLDTAGKKWVMNFLASYTKTVVIISHDLPLLNQAIDKVLLINTHSHAIDEYTGNYQNYLKLKKERDELLKRQIINEQKHIARMKEGLSKMVRFTSAKGVRQRTMLKKRIAKLEESLPELPREIKAIKLRLPLPAHVGELPIMIKDIFKSYGNRPILYDVTLSIRRAERVALIGPNGAGKSTFIKIAMGLLEPDKGQVIKDYNLKIGYYSQEFEQFDFAQNLFDFMTDKTHQPEGVVRAILGKFMFSGPKIYQTIATLSGGEKTRLAIALLLADNNNLLILDEPTTYLDVISQRVILESLKAYTGAMLVVSHTPDFIRELKPSRALFLPSNRIEYWEDEMAQRVGEM